MYSPCHNSKLLTTSQHSTGLDFLASLVSSVELFYHPSNTGAWTGRLAAFMNGLCTGMSSEN